MAYTPGMRTFLIALFAVSFGRLYGQSPSLDARQILQATKDMPPTSTFATRIVFPGPTASSVAPPFQNLFTFFADYVPNSGVPCFDCVTGATGQTIGAAIPDSNVHADGTTMYEFNNYFVDYSYSGPCTETFLIQDAAKQYIVKVVYTFTDQQPGMSGFYYAPTTIPNYSGAAGDGLAITVVQCGSTYAVSYSPLYINYP